jgi:hypothetical protein
MHFQGKSKRFRGDTEHCLYDDEESEISMSQIKTFKEDKDSVGENSDAIQIVNLSKSSHPLGLNTVFETFRDDNL